MIDNHQSNTMSLPVYNTLSDKWTFWAHLPHDINWDLESYKNIFTLGTVQEALVLCETIPDKMVKNCMLFLMRDGVKPTWEDDLNREGGCFSYKVNNKIVNDVWKKIFYLLIGNSLSDNDDFSKSITGITISPKKNFCIIKVWISNCDYQDPTVVKVENIKGLTNNGCLFKKHLPEK